MKLLCVTPSYWPAVQFGGPIHSLHLLNRFLVKDGVDLTVYTTNVGIENKVPKINNLDGVKINYFSYINFLDFLGSSGWHFSVPLTKELSKNIKQFNIVYILGIWNYTTLISCYFCRKYKIPYILSPRGHLYPEVINNKRLKKTFIII